MPGRSHALGNAAFDRTYHRAPVVPEANHSRVRLRRGAAPVSAVASPASVQNRSSVIAHGAVLGQARLLPADMHLARAAARCCPELRRLGWTAVRTTHHLVPRDIESLLRDQGNRWNCPYFARFVLAKTRARVNGAQAADSSPQRTPMIR